MQINTNGIRNKLNEITDLTKSEHIDILNIQESKLTPKVKTPKIPGFTPVRKDRPLEDGGGGLITYIRNNIEFSEVQTPANLIKTHFEILTIKIRFRCKQFLFITNLYIPPRKTGMNNEDTELTNLIEHLTSPQFSIISGDINAHDALWHSSHSDQRGKRLSNLLSKSNHIVLNLDTPTRIPPAANQTPSTPDITTITSELHSHTTWKTLNALHSDHLPIILTLNTKYHFRLQTQRHTFTNYQKADWQNFTKFIDDSLANSPEPTDVHKANKLLTDVIQAADKRFIPKGKIKNTDQPLPAEIRELITQRNNLRRIKPDDPQIKRLADTITSLITAHKTQIWQEKLNQNWDHKTNSHKLWQTIHQLSGKQNQAQPNRVILFDNKEIFSQQEITRNFNCQFTSVIKHQTDKTNRKINRTVNCLRSDEISITAEEITRAIHSSKNSKSTGPDQVSSYHLKHLGPTAIVYLTKLYNLSLNHNVIPQIWKVAKVVPIPKPGKDLNQGSSYRPISLLSPLAKTLEKIILPHLTDNVPNISSQHGFKKKHSTITALQEINHIITSGLNKKPPPDRTIAITIDMSKAFDTVNHHRLINKLLSTDTPATITKFISNYIKGRKAFTTYNNCISKQRIIRTGVPQGGVLSPSLFNLYLSDLPTPPTGVNTVSYADDITPLSSHYQLKEAETQLQPYLDILYNWTATNQLKINPDKCAATVFSTDPSEYKYKTSLTINGKPIPSETHPKILGVTFDPTLTFNKHADKTVEKARKSIDILKSLSGKTWGKSKETILATYNAITKSQLEYGCSVWGPTLKQSNMDKLSKIQNQALRIATGSYKSANLQHLHEECSLLPIPNHIKLHTSLFNQRAQLPSHPSHKLTLPNTNARHLRQTAFDNVNFTVNITTDTNHPSTETIKANCKTIHSTIVQNYLSSLKPNPIINQIPPPIHNSELSLSRDSRCLLSQLRSGHSRFLLKYLNLIDPNTYPSPICPACNSHEHNTTHLFNCPTVPNPLNLTPLDLWIRPVEAAEVLALWRPLLPHLN
jgi:hypothetical protein